MNILDYKTLIQPVIERAHQNPDQPLIYFVNEDGSEDIIRAGDFHADAAAYARALKTLGIHQDDLVILVLRHSKTLLSAFWGAMYLGAIVSIFPFLTEKLDPEIYKERVKTLVTLSKARAVITFPEFKTDLTNILDGTGCQVLSTIEVPFSNTSDYASEFSEEFSSEKIAFLQHSSGTTGLQKGVALSHRAVLNHVDALSQAIRLISSDVFVSWLPLYHDMGLIGGFILPIITNTPLVLMSPFHWVREPKIMLQAISRHRGTLSWQPNFAFNHTVRSIRKNDLMDVDLSCVRMFINCSEPVRLDSLNLFLERFRPLGLGESQLSASYGMAETTFIATQTPPGEFPAIDWVMIRSLQEDRFAMPAAPNSPGATPVVSCGFPIPNVVIRVVDPQGQDLPERQVGEIILRSNCLLTGYYHRPELTAQQVINGWFYSGDYGYIAGGQVYVSGRKKDMIIVAGKNIFPQDLEAVADTLDGLSPGRNVAFGVLDETIGSESIVMVCELENPGATDTEKRGVERALRLRVVQQTEVVLSDVRLVGRKWLIKTTSGKIARATNRQKYLSEFPPH